jgi:putative inorganic carbon (HCO3(-)) transporter
VVVICLSSTEMGLYVNMAYSFFISHFNRLLFGGDLQVGVFSDALILITFLSLFVRRINWKQSINQFAKSPVVTLILVIYGYMAIEMFNPSANSLAGWFAAFRKILGTLLLLFISYNVFDSLASIKRFIKVLFVMCFLAALYGCIQQWHGLFQFEIEWVMKDPKSFAQMFMNGEFKKMSTMIAPDTFAFIMGSMSVFFIALIDTQKKFRSRAIVSVAGILLMVMGMSFSGIRTANAMIVAGVAMFILLTFDKVSTRIFAGLSVFALLVLLYGPFNNLQIERFRATFEAKDDDSYNVRERNRKSIQPYIYAHPIGGGLGTTGNEGKTFNPGHVLAGFPPDSGYLKKALEMGWIGFTLIVALYFLILKTGITGYFRSRDTEIKLIYAACTAACFSFYTGEITQVAIGQITDIVVYYPMIAILLKLKNFDRNVVNQPITNLTR